MASDEYELKNSTKRFTKQRQAILETLKSSHSHPDANWIYKKVSRKIPNISLGTVYRNLNILIKEEIIKELTYQPNVVRYDANRKLHHHIICYSCNKIEDVKQDSKCDLYDQMKKTILKNYDYNNISCEILFTGLCNDCQNEKHNNQENLEDNKNE